MGWGLERRAVDLHVLSRSYCALSQACACMRFRNTLDDFVGDEREPIPEGHDRSVYASFGTYESEAKQKTFGALLVKCADQQLPAHLLSRNGIAMVAHDSVGCPPTVQWVEANKSELNGCAGISALTPPADEHLH